MAVARRKETPAERAKRDAVDRARRGPRWDAFGEYLEKAAELAEKLGIGAVEIYEEFCERAAIRHYLGELDIQEAERKAWEDVLGRFVKQQELL